MPKELAEAIASKEDIGPSEDKLDQVRSIARQLRDLYATKKDLDQRLDEIKSQIVILETKTLVDIFNEVKIPAISLDAEGNNPAVDLEKQPFYSAKIPEGREGEAFAWLEEEGHGDLIKSKFNINFGMGDFKQAKKFETWLTKQKIDFNNKIEVHSATLLAFVKKELQATRPIPMDLFGVFTGEIVKIQQRKAKK
jgi:hypothetical protein